MFAEDRFVVGHPKEGLLRGVALLDEALDRLCHDIGERKLPRRNERLVTMTKSVSAGDSGGLAPMWHNPVGRLRYDRSITLGQHLAAPDNLTVGHAFERVRELA